MIRFDESNNMKNEKVVIKNNPTLKIKTIRKKLQ